MFLLDKDKNRIQQIEKKTFAELGLKEREHLQEWIANQPDALNKFWRPRWHIRLMLG